MINTVSLLEVSDKMKTLESPKDIIEAIYQYTDRHTMILLTSNSTPVSYQSVWFHPRLMFDDRETRSVGVESKVFSTIKEGKYRIQDLVTLTPSNDSDQALAEEVKNFLTEKNFDPEFNTGIQGWYIKDTDLK